MLVTLEGIDGSGKTTVWEALRGAHGGEWTFTHEPTDSWYGEAARKSIDSEESDSMAELFLLTADHADHLARVVRPALEAGEVVVSDRFADSRYAYQGVSLEGVITRPMEYVRGIHQPFTRTPDVTLYFDVPPETGAARAGATDKFEGATFLREVQSNYEDLISMQPGRFVRIDATQSPEDVLDRVEDVLARVVEEAPDR